MKKNNYIFIIPLIIIFLCLIGLYGWGVVKISAIENKTDELQLNIDNETSLLKNIDQGDLKNKVEEEKNDLALLSSYFVIQGQEFVLIQKIEDLCQQVSVTCTIKPTSGDSIESLPPNFQSLHVIVTASGKFSSLYQLGSILENLPYKIYIQEMNLQQNEEGESGNRWQEIFSFNVVTKK